MRSKRQQKVLLLILADATAILSQRRLINDVCVAVALCLRGKPNIGARESIILAAESALYLQTRQRAQMGSFGPIFFGRRHQFEIHASQSHVAALSR